jgi:hypothetical protein
MSTLDDPRVVAALIAVLGVLASALVSVRVSRSQAEIASRNLIIQFSHKLNDRLYEKRLEVYPALYEALSLLGKRLRSASLSRLDFVQALEQIESWDSKRAIYVSPAIIALLLNIRNLLVLSITTQENIPISESEIRNLFDAALRLEQALKHELGVYSSADLMNAPLYKGPLDSWRPPPSDGSDA